MKKLLAQTFLFLALATTSLFAQEGDAKAADEKVEEFVLSGSLDTYFHQSFNTIEEAPHTSFSNLPGFSLGMINLVGTYKGKKSGFVADLVYGPRGSDAIFNAPMYKNANGAGSSHIINQMYVYYNFSKNVKLSFGQFNTFIGYEFISPTMNFHYSTSYLFSYGPFNHTGVWADVNLGKGWTTKFAITNPTDYTEFNPFNSYTLGGQLAFAGNSQSIYLNMIYGDPDGKLQSSDSVGTISRGNNMQLDITASFSVTDKYALSIGASYCVNGPGETKTATAIESSALNSAGFYGIVLYQKLSVSPSFQLGLRTEYFGEFKNGVGAIGSYNSSGKASVVETTFTANFISGNFKLIPELRLDKTSTAAYAYSATNSPSSTMLSLNVAVVYTLPAMVHKIQPAK